MNKLFIIIIIFVGIGFLLTHFKPTKKYTYKSKPFLTNNELEFLNRLEKALPEMRIHCQVAMSALIMPTAPRSSRDFLSARGRFAQKYVDYVVQQKNTGNVIAIIELDDKTHNTEKDATRDAMLNAAGYKIFRFESKKKPTVEEIKNTLSCHPERVEG